MNFKAWMMCCKQDLLISCLIHRNLDRDLHITPVVSMDACSWHDELMAAIGIGQPVREIRGRHSEHCSLIMADQLVIAPEPTVRDHESYFLYSLSLASRTDADDRHNAAKQVVSHVHQKKVLLVILVGKHDEIEAGAEARTEAGLEEATEAGNERGPPRTHRRAWPAVRAGNVVQHRRRVPNEGASLARTVARHVRACQDVLLAAVVCRRRHAAVGGVRAWATHELHHGLHGVAPAVAASHGDAAEVALAGGPELVTAGRAHHVPHVALHGPMHKQYQCISLSGTLMNLLFDLGPI